jgi:hypothetical protein
VADTPSSSAPETPKSNLPPERQDEDFQPIAQLVTPNPPEWFREYLHFLYWSVWRISVLEDEQPSRAEMLRTLAEVKNAAEVLMNALGRPVVLEILGTIRPVHIPKVLYLLVMLRDLHDQARNASQSPILVKMDGRARPGQGRAFAEQTISARTYCALVIVECWKHFNGAYPPPRNRRAAEAAETYWKASIGKKSGYGGIDVLEGWRPHFKTARSSSADRKRAEIFDLLRQWEAKSSEAKTGGNVGDGN